ncbi:MAG: NUDIX domain-containing protein [Bacteroidales bacterium]|nr:NUDIX domain-containing protein [Bacteroidales bacterium]
MYTYEYPRPMVTVDMVVIRKQNDHTEVLLIERGNEPFKNHWALPGGFIEMEETIEASAYRELQEETSITEVELRVLKTYGDPGRDPRGRTVSIVFGGILKSKQKAIAGDDAAKAAWFSINELPELAFDHGLIVRESLSLLL